MRIIFSAGGTGGHVNPAIAMAEKIRERYPEAEILFVGREGGRENRTVTDSGFKIKTLKVSGISKSLSLSTLRSVILAARATREAKGIIREFSPDVIVGTGGYVCWPMLRAGQGLGIPTVIHESNALAGRTTRLLARHCSLVMVNYEETARQLDKRSKVIAVGNPLRSGFGRMRRETARRSLGLGSGDILIVSFGGSIGAEKINSVCAELMRRYSSREGRIRHIHASGERHYDNFPSDFKRERNGCVALPYIDDMARVLAAADIAITRAGALTLSELACVGAAAILIPSPNVKDNHQYENARLVADSGGAVLIEEGNLTYDSLLPAIRRLCEKSEERLLMQRKIRRFYKSGASEACAEAIINQASFKGCGR